MWLASLNRCWTADRLARRGLDHPEKCLLCDQEEETILHILLRCVFAREVWHRILSLIGLQQLSPKRDVVHFQDWYLRWLSLSFKEKISILLSFWWPGDFGSIETLVCLMGHLQAAPQLLIILKRLWLWGLAGAAGLRNLWP